MPVTTYPSPEKVGKYDGTILESSDDRMLLNYIAEFDSQPTPRFHEKAVKKEKRPLLGSSFDLRAAETSKIAPLQNGFVDGLIHAFERDLHLEIRPDDVWLSIMTQFCMYINGNAERLRRVFVQHEGRKDSRSI